MPEYTINEVQHRAVTYGTGPLLLLAGPGSGKTFTIIQRILYLIEKQSIPPEKILVISYTKDSVKSIKDRFNKISKAEYKVNFATFHSCFYHILKSFPNLDKYKLISEQDKNTIVKDISKKYLKDESDISFLMPDNILSAISYMKNTDNIDKACEKFSDEYKIYFSEIFNEYVCECKKRFLLDFDDMLFKCIDYLKMFPQIHDKWKNMFEYILIDEFQDINPIQYKALKMITKPPYNIMAVGDDDQSIYSFRGSSYNCIYNFKKEFNANQILLNINYRSCKEIVNASLKVINQNTNRFYKDLIPSDCNIEGNVGIRCFTSIEEEVNYIISNIVEPDNTAILFRTNYSLNVFSDYFEKSGIDYCRKTARINVFNSFIAKDFLTYIKLGKNSFDRKDFFVVMNHPSRFISREHIPEKITCFEDILSNLNDNTLKDRIINLRNQATMMYNMSPFAAFHYFYNCINYKKYVNELIMKKPNKKAEYMAIVNKFKEITIVCKDFDTLYKKIDEYQEEEEYKKGRVKLLTIHSSKGLEFEHVFIPDCNEGNFPYGKVLTDEEVEEERRIFYVGMTRAKKNLELLFIKNNKSSSKPISRFLNPFFN